MTIHGAKGLEAPVVILPDCAKARTGGGRGPLLVPLEGENGRRMLWRAPKAEAPQALRQAQEARDDLAARGRDLAYTTVATLVRILADKGFLTAANDQRPFRYRPMRPFPEVARLLLGDLVDRVFHGSREQLLLRLFEDRPLGRDERAVLEKLLAEIDS